MSNVVQLFPPKKEPELVRLPGLDDVIGNVIDWAESAGVDTSTPTFVFTVSEIMQRLQLLIHREAA